MEDSIRSLLRSSAPLPWKGSLTLQPHRHVQQQEMGLSLEPAGDEGDTGCLPSCLQVLPFGLGPHGCPWPMWPSVTFPQEPLKTVFRKGHPGVTTSVLFLLHPCLRWRLYLGLPPEVMGTHTPDLQTMWTCHLALSISTKECKFPKQEPALWLPPQLQVHTLPWTWPASSRAAHTWLLRTHCGMDTAPTSRQFTCLSSSGGTGVRMW